MWILIRKVICWVSSRLSESVETAFDRSVRLVSCSNDMSIKIWDTQNSYKNTKTLQGHDHSVSSVRFLPPQGDFLVSASRDKTVRIWEVATG